MTNRPDLIEQLEKLNPTKRQWVYDGSSLIRCFRKNLFIAHDAKQDDIHLITLAPTMRLEILAMAKEVEDMHEEIRLNRIRLGQYSDFRRDVLEIPDELIKKIDNKHFPF